jgi:hypothetical protein
MRSQIPILEDRSFWLPYRKFLTARFLPEPVYVKDLYYKRPFWYGLDIALTSQQTLEARQAVRYGFWLLALTGTCAPGPTLNNFQLQIYHVRSRGDSDETPWQRLKTLLAGKFSRTLVDRLNALGTAQRKYWLRRPYRFEQGDTIIVQAKNLTTANLTARLTLEGVDDGDVATAPA